MWYGLVIGFGIGAIVGTAFGAWLISSLQNIADETPESNESSENLDAT